jgi:hypothetical protein
MTTYKILSQDPILDDENENDFSLSSDGSQDSLDLVLINIGNKKRKKRLKRNYRRASNMVRINGFDTNESYEVSNCNIFRASIILKKYLLIILTWPLIEKKAC